MKIDKETNETLRRKYNSEGSELRKLQLRELEILRYVDKVCREHDIPYWLSGGSCLGAVRHAGFIPWDDDVDIEMLRPDYLRFKKIVAGQPHPDYVFHDMDSDPNYFLGFGKVRDLHSRLNETKGFDKNYIYKGCFVDVFPVIPSNSRKLHSLGILLNMKMMYAMHEGNRVKSTIWKGIFRISAPVLRFLSSVHAKGRYRYDIGVSFTETLDYGDISERTGMDFEGIELPVPRRYDSYLTRMYGDYMALPTEDNIHIHTTDFEIL